MAVEFDGDVVIVTGGAGGLGGAYCRLLAGLGARVVVNDTGGVVDGTGGNPDAAASVVRVIEEAGGSAIADTGDGSKIEDAQALVKNAIDAFGRVDAVIANAGILRDASFHKVSDEDFMAVMQAHFVGTMRVFHAAYPHMREQGYGRLVGTTSGAGLFGNFGQTNYGAAKMAIVGLCTSLAIEGAKNDIKVNVIAPGARSRMTEALMPPAVAEIMTPDNVAPLGAYLTSKACSISGQVISAAGGRFARVRTGVNMGVYNESPDPDFVEGSIDEISEQEIDIWPSQVFEELMLFARAAGIDLTASQ